MQHNFSDMSILIEQWHRQHGREEKGVVPSACLLEFVCLFVCLLFVVGCFVCLLGCVFVCLFVRSFVGLRGAGCVKVCFG